VVALLGLDGSGEKKSNRLNPFHLGKGLFSAPAENDEFDKLNAAVAAVVVLMKFLLFIPLHDRRCVDQNTN
jgi:hypothetical protein